MPRLSKQGNPESGLVENNFRTTSVSHGDQSFPQHYYNGNVQVRNYTAPLHGSNLIAFQTFRPKSVVGVTHCVTRGVTYLVTCLASS